MGSSLRARIGRSDALLLSAGIWFLAKFLRYAFPPLFEELHVIYDVSTAELGAAFTGLLVVYAAMQFPSGVLADRIGSVSVIAGGALLASLGALTVVLGDRPVPFADSFWVLVAAMIVIGAGTGAHKTVSIRLLSRLYRERTGRALGVFDTFGTFGGVVAPAAVALALSAQPIVELAWRDIYLFGGALGLVLAGLFGFRAQRWRSADEPQADDGETKRRREDGPVAIRYLAPFRSTRVALFLLAALCFSIAYNGLIAFLPLYLSRTVGLDAATSSLLYGLLFAVSFVQLGTGELSDRIGQERVLFGTLGLAAGSLGLLLVAPPTPALRGIPVVLASAILGLGLGSHGFRPVRGAYLSSLLPNRVTGGGLGIVRTILMGAGAFAPVAIGAIAAVASLQVAFGLVLATLVAAVALVIPLVLAR